MTAFLAALGEPILPLEWRKRAMLFLLASGFALLGYLQFRLPGP